MTPHKEKLIKALNTIRDIIRFYNGDRLPKDASRQIDTIAQAALRPYLKRSGLP